MICDWKDTVRKIKPFCESSKERPVIPIGEWKTEPVTTIRPRNATTPAKLVSLNITRPAIPATTVKPFKQKPYLTVCDPAVPHIEHPYSCYKFLHCVPDAEGSYYYAEKTCNPPTMYHPVSMVCEWKESVNSVKPKCGTAPEDPEPDWEETVIIEETIKINKTKKKPGYDESEEMWSLCENGFVWSQCAYPCGKACRYYNYLLYETGACQRDSNECVPGCIPAGSAQDCRPKLWRDSQTCVDIADCICVTEDNKPVKV